MEALYRCVGAGRTLLEVEIPSLAILVVYWCRPNLPACPAVLVPACLSLTTFSATFLPKDFSGTVSLFLLFAVPISAFSLNLMKKEELLLPFRHVTGSKTQPTRLKVN